MSRDGHPVLRKTRAVFPVQPEHFRAVPVEKLRFSDPLFPVKPENMRVITPVCSGSPLEPDNRVRNPDNRGT